MNKMNQTNEVELKNIDEYTYQYGTHDASDYTTKYRLFQMETDGLNQIMRGILRQQMDAVMTRNRKKNDNRKM